VTRKGKLSHNQRYRSTKKERKIGYAESPDKGQGIIAVLVRKSKASGWVVIVSSVSTLSVRIAWQDIRRNESGIYSAAYCIALNWVIMTFECYSFFLHRSMGIYVSQNSSMKMYT
jgi:hypothetical protein